MTISTARGLRERLQAWFPEREFFMRSGGQVRFIKVTSRAQMGVAGATIGVMALLGASAGTITANQYYTEAEREELQARAAQVASAASGVAAYQDEVRTATARLERRQAFLEEVAEMLPEPDGEPQATTEPAGEKLSAAVPGATALNKLEARQFALAERLIRFAQARTADSERSLRKLGLSPRAIVASARLGQGGPLHKLTTESDGTVHPLFARLGASLARMDALEQGLDGIPQYVPTDMRMVSSAFGYRRDPFTGDAALHSGLDFRGPVGAPIHAAADGRVSFVGVKSGYGTVVDISHDNGLMTRYAHMSRAKARLGQAVSAGDVIGAIGSSGRSTGPHLHFEVRIDGRAVNPRPFLQADQ